ncbi:hypothetical protein KIL84_015408 [Mauremys mutica]|uniref:Uncharacterized protein n=1 Tax=Mauremys mutica TaxID=74926 RepID=A0A9D3WQR1_9SAUR|nr:hypothetical protein KIL84_015408 [Mauremys mutica]
MDKTLPCCWYHWYWDFYHIDRIGLSGSRVSPLCALCSYVLCSLLVQTQQRECAVCPYNQVSLASSPRKHLVSEEGCIVPLSPSSAREGGCPLHWTGFPYQSKWDGPGKARTKIQG